MNKRSERLLRVFMRVDAAFQILAFPVVLIPIAWIAEIHEFVGLGTFPDEPIAEYLARSLSAFYVLHGVMTLMLATDVIRYRPVIRVWAVTFIGLGVAAVTIDIRANMPLYWTIVEGGFVTVFGTVIFLLSRGTAEA